MRPRIEERDLDVEEQEDHRHEVELDRLALARVADRRHAAFVGRQLFGRRLPRARAASAPGRSRIPNPAPSPIMIRIGSQPCMRPFTGGFRPRTPLRRRSRGPRAPLRSGGSFAALTRVARRRSRGPRAPLRSNLRRCWWRRLPAVALAKAGPACQSNGSGWQAGGSRRGSGARL